MFLSPVFRQTLANISGATIELYDTDGAVGAARGAALGAGIYSSAAEAFRALKRLDDIRPVTADSAATSEAYGRWLAALDRNR